MTLRKYTCVPPASLTTAASVTLGWFAIACLAIACGEDSVSSEDQTSADSGASEPDATEEDSGVSQLPPAELTITYDGLADVTEPQADSTEAHVDTLLRLTFDAAPQIGEQGSINIHRADDDSVVDSVSVGAETDALGPPSGTGAGNVRHVNARLVIVDDDGVVIKLHDGALNYATDYYVSISEDAFLGELSGDSFAGLGKAAGWSFTTRAAAPESDEVSVDDDGSDADFRSVQGALNYVMQNFDADAPTRVLIRDGVYTELLFLRGKRQLTIEGESRDGVIVRYENFEGFNPGTGSSTATPSVSPGGGRSLFLIENADELSLDSFTLNNTHLRSGSGDQAETIYFNNSSGRLVAKHMAFLSEQDTIQVKGFSWFYDSLIAGNVDFIWGNNLVALFEDSEIRSLGDSKGAALSGGYILQARTVRAPDKGFVFLNSRLTYGTGPGGTDVATGERAATYLARSAGEEVYFDNVAFINCSMDEHIAPIGWAEEGVNGQPAPNPAQATAESGWKEYGSLNPSGDPLDMSERSGSAYTLSDEEYEAEYSTREQIFSGWGNGKGWNPQP